MRPIFSNTCLRTSKLAPATQSVRWMSSRTGGATSRFASSREQNTRVAYSAPNSLREFRESERRNLVAFHLDASSRLPAIHTRAKRILFEEKRTSAADRRARSHGIGVEKQKIIVRRRSRQCRPDGRIVARSEAVVFGAREHSSPAPASR